MSDPLSFQGLPEHPRLHAGVLVQQGDSGPFLKRGTHAGAVAIELGPDARSFVEGVLPLLDGARSARQLVAALESDFSPEDLLEALHALAEEGFIVEGTPPAGPIDGLRCYRAMRAAEPEWVEEARAAAPQEGRPLAELSGEEFLRYLRGWWTENLHFAASAMKKFALAAHDHPEHRAVLSHFMLEEHEHILLFRRAARELGLDAERCMRAPPLPETAALNAFILHGCRRHPLYLAWIADKVERGVARTVDDPVQGPAPISRLLRERLTDRPKFLELYFSHVELELAGEHGSYGRDMFARTAALPPEDVALLRSYAQLTEHLFARRAAAEFRAYGAGRLSCPRPAENPLAAMEPGEPPRAVAEPVREIARQSAARLGSSAALGRLEAPGAWARLGEAWVHVQREWAIASLSTPVLNAHFDSRFACTRLAVGLNRRAEALGTPAGGPPPPEAHGLAAVIAEAAGTDPALALGQAALLEEVGRVLGPHLSRLLPPEALRPLNADSPQGPASPAQALELLGPLGPPQAQPLGVHLQVLGELLAALLEGAAARAEP